MSIRSVCLALALVPAVLWFVEPLMALAETPPVQPPTEISISVGGPFTAQLTGSPGEFQGVHFRSQGDPVLYVGNPAGVSAP